MLSHHKTNIKQGRLGAFGVGEVGGLPPRGDGDDPCVGLAGLPEGAAVHVDTRCSR